MKIIIAGGRDFSDYDKLCKEVDFALSKCEISRVEIVSGAAKGADSLGEKYARDHGIKLKQFSADWEKYGKAAGYKRNSEMGNYADALIAFWDGKSKGTFNMINIANKKGLQVRIVKYESAPIKYVERKGI